MERLICLLIGYGFGLFQTGYIYGRMHNVDIRKVGSGDVYKRQLQEQRMGVFSLCRQSMK